MSQPLVISLGGNAFAGADEIMTMAGQFEFAAHTLSPLADLLQRDAPMLITHGNGPQVGYILTRVEEALGKAYALPLEVCVAESEGPWFEAGQVAALERAGMALVYDNAGKARRVVPSPKPLAIVEVDVIRQMLDLGLVVIAAGGGGIPVVERDGRLQGVEAVVDKDLATALLAAAVGAERLVLVTGVDGVYRDFGTDNARRLSRPGRDELRALAAEGHFPPGSMGPRWRRRWNLPGAPASRHSSARPRTCWTRLPGAPGH